MKAAKTIFLFIFICGGFLAENYNAQNSKILIKDEIKSTDPFASFRSYIGEDWIDGQWVLSSKMIVTREGGKVTGVVNEGWENGVVNFATRFSFSYNSDGQIIEWLSELDENGGGNFVNTTKEIMSYTGGKNTSSLSQKWDNGVWNDYTRDTYTYSGEKMSEVLTEEYKNGTWQNQFKINYIYSGGNLSEQRWAMWNNGAWEETSKYTYEYDNANRNVKSISEIWDGSAWKQASMTSYVYDSNGNLIEEEDESEFIPGMFIKDKTIYTYENNNVAVEESYEWDFLTNDYNSYATERVEHTYQDSELYQSISKEWDLVESNYKNRERITYTLVTDIKTNSEIPITYSLSNYPNPFNPATKIEFSLPIQTIIDLNIYNINGELVKRVIEGGNLSSGVHNITWNGEDNDGNKLATGIYIISLYSKNATMYKKCILLK